MKTHFLFLTLIATLSCNVSSKAQQSKELAKVVNGVSKLTVDEKTLIDVFSKNLLSQSKIEGNFTSANFELNKEIYYLVFRGPSIRSTFVASRGPAEQDGSFALRVEENKVTCTTSDCASEQFGCVPDGNVGSGACTPCSNQGKCTKTVSNQSLLE